MRKPYTLTVDERGDVLVAGPDPNNPSLVFVAKLDSYGTVLWRRWLDQSEPRVTPVPDSGRVSWEPTDDELRDSFEPLLLDGQRRSSPTPVASRWRRLSASIAAACIVSASLAGVAMARGQAAAAPPSIMAQASMTQTLTPTAAWLDEPRPEELNVIAPAPAWTATFDELGLDENASPDELRGAALILLELGEPQHAHHVAERLVELTPNGAYGYLLAGAALQELGRRAEARSLYRTCADQTKGDPSQLTHASECRALAAF